MKHYSPTGRRNRGRLLKILLHTRDRNRSTSGPTPWKIDDDDDYDDGIKVNQSDYRPWQALRVPGCWGSQISRPPAHEVGKFVSPTHRPPLLKEIFLVLISVRGWVDPSIIARPEGLCQWKNPVPPSEIETTTVRFVAQCLQHCTQALRYRVPHTVLLYEYYNIMWPPPYVRSFVGRNVVMRRISVTSNYQLSETQL
jgi:hypothetical protein